MFVAEKRHTAVKCDRGRLYFIDHVKVTGERNLGMWQRRCRTADTPTRPYHMVVDGCWKWWKANRRNKIFTAECGHNFAGNISQYDSCWRKALR